MKNVIYALGQNVNQFGFRSNTTGVKLYLVAKTAISSGSLIHVFQKLTMCFLEHSY